MLPPKTFFFDNLSPGSLDAVYGCLYRFFFIMEKIEYRTQYDTEEGQRVFSYQNEASWEVRHKGGWSYSVLARVIDCGGPVSFFGHAIDDSLRS